MSTKIKCPQCGHILEISQVLSRQLETKYAQKIEELKKEYKTKAIAAVRKEYDVKITSTKEQAAAEQQENQKLRQEIASLLKEVREAKGLKAKMEIEFQKKMLAEQDSISQKAKKEVQLEMELNMAEKTKKLLDAEKQIKILQQKIQQGSQQAQGEVMELALEEQLKKNFPFDEVSPVKTGQKGADILQTVVDKRNRRCGTILWESKNAKWNQSWLKKLREDQRQAKAHLAVLVVANPPEDLETYDYLENVWITTRKLAIPLATALRFDLIHLNQEKLNHVNKNEKTELLYQYLTGTEFVHRVEGIVEAFTNLQTDIEKEKRWFNLKWARQEKELRKIVDHTIGMYGELQASTGRSLKPIKRLELTD